MRRPFRAPRPRRRRRFTGGCTWVMGSDGRGHDVCCEAEPVGFRRYMDESFELCRRHQRRWDKGVRQRGQTSGRWSSE